MHNLRAGNPVPQTSPATAIAVVVGVLFASGRAFTVRVLVSSGGLRRSAAVRAVALTAEIAATWPVQFRVSAADR